MKKTRVSAKIMALVLCFTMLVGNAVMVNAKTVSETYQAIFDADYYYTSNPDLQAALGYDAKSLYEHFVSAGIYEGRAGCADFDLGVYMANNPDLLEAYGSDLLAYVNHYTQIGWTEGRITHADGVTPVSKVIGVCTTKYKTNEARATNIAVAVSRINGVVVEPGAQFSYNETILPRSAANGYVMAPIYISGKHGMDIGGGICQVSSTLYSAMLNAGVPATERHPHSLPVTYLPEGRDATIAGNYLDLKFVNNQASPLQIWSSINGGNGTVTVMLIRQ